MKKSLLWLVIVFGLAYSTTASAAPFMVNSTGDDTDGVCNHPYIDASTDCTLREAIIGVNSNPGGPHNVDFDISSLNFPDDGDGQFTISLLSALPFINKVGTTISAVNMWDSAGASSNRPGVVLDGSGAGNGTDGLTINQTDVNIQGLEIKSFGSDGISVEQDNATIGTNCDGTNDAKERNVIVRNGGYGINVASNAIQNVIAGNYIGLDEVENTDKGNDGGGVILSSTGNTVGYNDAGCSSEVQRNYISGNSGSGIEIFGASNTVSGNYIGVSLSGETEVGNDAHGVYISGNSQNNIIGTNGDGTNDGNEGNVVSANGSHGIFVVESEDQDGIGGPDNTLISGNIVGLSASENVFLSNALNGIAIRADDIVVGWCGAATSSICSDGGTKANEQNIVFANTDGDGIRFGLRADNGFIFGNLIGVNSFGEDPGNLGKNGIGVIKRNAGHTIGGAASNQTNIISNFENGLRINHSSTSQTDPAENIAVENNSFTENEVGVQCTETLEFATGAYTYEILLDNNTISDNTGNGVELFGCSWDLQDNTITGNGDWGVSVLGQERPDDPSIEDASDSDVIGSNYDNPYDSPSPDNAANDLVSTPRMQGNIINSNTAGGITFLEAAATNAATLLTDNTFASNNGNNHIQQSWYAGFELLDTGNSPITTGSYDITYCSVIDSCSASSDWELDASAGGDAVWGTTGVDYDDATTWQTVTDYRVDANGSTIDYNPYTITVAGDTENQTGVEYSFDGVDNDTASAGGVSNGITTNGVYRYQIAEIETSSIPDTPTNITPADAAVNVSLTPTLVASAFSDGAESHTASDWNIYSSEALCTAGSGGDIYENLSESSLINISVPSGTLDATTTYYWRVAYQNSFGNQSSLSNCTSFTTISTAPEFSGNISDQSWNEDESLSDAFDLDTYFSDDEGETISYTVTNSESDNITVSISDDNRVSFASEDDWNGSATLTITGCDTDAECVSSNELALTVNSVNDSPTKPTSGFSPADGDVTADQTPRIRWNAGTDVDHTASQLQYQIRIGKNSNPAETYNYSATTSAGTKSYTLTAALDDETKYYYVVRTVDPAGAKSNWSAVQDFTVNTELTPNLTLTKEISEVSSISLAMQALRFILASALTLPIPLPVYGDVGSASLVTLLQIFLHTIMWLAVLFTAFITFGLLALGRSYRDVLHLMFASPSKAYARIHQIKPKASKPVSYHSFKSRLLTLRTALSIAILLFSSSLIVNATQAPIIQSSIQSLTSDITTEPGQQLQVTVYYSNAGDGDATSTELVDTIPSGTSYVTGSLSFKSTTVSDSAVSDSIITINPGTITDGDTATNRSGNISYQVEVDNPFTGGSSLTFAAATLTANELSDSGESSNTLSVAVASASVSGRVTSAATGTGLSGTNLTFTLDDETITTTATNSAGNYNVSGLGDGLYAIAVAAPSGYQNPANRNLTVSADSTYSGIDFALTAAAGSGGDDSTGDGATDDSGSSESDSNGDGLTDDQKNTKEDELRDKGIPDELLDDFHDLPEYSDEEQALIDTLTDQLEVVNDLSLDASEAVSSGVRAIVDDFRELLFPSSNNIILEGIAPPNSKIVISICYVLAETESDAEGKWVMVIPESLLQPGENVFYATAEKDGVVSNKVEVARVVVDEPSLISRTALFGYLSLLAAIFTLNLVVIIVLLRRQRKTGKKVLSNGWLWSAIICMILSLAALLGSFAVQNWHSYDVSAESRQIQENIMLDELNDKAIPPGDEAEFSDTDVVHFTGDAPADVELAITLCDNQPFRKTTSSAAGVWDVSVPVDLLPKARFTVSAQAVAGEDLGSPHRLVDLDIVSKNLLTQVNILLLIAYILLFMSAAAIWMHSQVRTEQRGKKEK